MAAFVLEFVLNSDTFSEIYFFFFRVGRIDSLKLSTVIIS